MLYKFRESNGRLVFAGDFDALKALPTIAKDLRSKCSAVLLLTDCFSIEESALGRAAEAVVNIGSVEISCYGKESERVHDGIDWELDKHGLVGVVTTWHTTESNAEMAELFLTLRYVCSDPANSVLIVMLDPGSIAGERFLRVFDSLLGSGWFNRNKSSQLGVN